MVVKFPQLSCPLTTFALVGAVDFEIIQRLLQAFVGVAKDVLHFTGRTVLGAGFDLLNALLTEALPTTGSLAGLSKYQQTNGTLSLEGFRRFLYKFTLKSSHFESALQIYVNPNITGGDAELCG